MTDMPNELWIDTLACEGCPQVFTADCGKGFVKYTRSDKSDHLRKALEGAVEAMRVAKRDINNWFTSDEAKAAAIAPLDQAIAAGEEALK